MRNRKSNFIRFASKSLNLIAGIKGQFVLEISADYNEPQILLRVSRGDTRAFSLLYNRYRPRIYTTALSLTENSHS